MQFLRTLFVVITIAVLAGCQTTREVLNLDTEAKLKFSAAPNINPDRDARPSPVVLRVFLLSDRRQFDREDFLSLFENAETRLGSDLIREITLREFAPGEERIETLELSEDVKYLGIIAEFVNYQDADPIDIVEVKEHNKNTYDIQINRLSITHR
ncbi:type VI secretion system lipoprotein TssJ [Sessilibacter sp. MAH2]